MNDAGGVVRIVAAGDAALLAAFRQEIDPDINAQVVALAQALQHRCGSTIRDAVVGYATVTVYFDPLAVDDVWLEAEIRSAVTSLSGPSDISGPEVDVPVCYGGDFGPDLTEVAAFGSCSPDEVVALHTQAQYRVYMLGFVPGFAYMASVNPRIAAPRRSTPRTAVPRGSVAIAGGQTGVYPSVSPGGWNIIGRTPLEPFQPARPNPFLFHAGDSVRFRSISRDEYDAAR